MYKKSEEIVMKKSAALDMSPYLYLVGAAVALASTAAGAGAGIVASKLTEPGVYDKLNLKKLYLLQRKLKDIKMQQVLLEREKAERQMRNKNSKAIRVF